MGVKHAIAVGVGGVIVLAVGYLAYKYFKDDPIISKIKAELKRLGVVHIQNDDYIEFDELTKLISVIRRCTKELSKIDWRLNKISRETLLKAKDYVKYTEIVIKGYLIQKKSEEYVKSIIFDRLRITKEIFDGSVAKYEETKRYKIFLIELCDKRKIKKITEREAIEIFERKKSLEKEVTAEKYVPEELKALCIENIGENWKEVVKEYIIDDMLCIDYCITCEDTKELFYRYNLS